MAGRPKAKIDWEKVDKLLQAGCFTSEIAAYFGISPDTLYIRCKTDHNMEYSIYSQEKKAKGESLLREAQYKNAMEGNTPMQIWLGKQRLDQRDKPTDLDEDGKKLMRKFMMEMMQELDSE
ncbi:MAG: hypothetical protein PVF17_00465 [Ignavibacteria bacterium]|jgi:hypothetical protein